MSHTSPATLQITTAELADLLSAVHNLPAAKGSLPSDVRNRGVLHQQLAWAPFDSTAVQAKGAYVQVNPVCGLLGKLPSQLPPAFQNSQQARLQLIQRVLPGDWVVYEEGRKEPLPAPLLGLVEALLSHSGLELYRYVPTHWNAQAVIMFGGAGTGTPWHMDPGSAHTTLYEVQVVPRPSKGPAGKRLPPPQTRARVPAAAAAATSVQLEQDEQQQQSLPGGCLPVTAQTAPASNSSQRQQEPCLPAASSKRVKDGASAPVPGKVSAPCAAAGNTC
jgi:hypothetical protein